MAYDDRDKVTNASKTVVAKLRCLDLRGETVHTRWGDVIFDQDGLAELEVPEHEYGMLRDVRPYSWLAEDQVPAAAPADLDKAPDGDKKPTKGDKKR